MSSIDVGEVECECDYSPGKILVDALCGGFGAGKDGYMQVAEMVVRGKGGNYVRITLSSAQVRKLIDILEVANSTVRESYLSYPSNYKFIPPLPSEEEEREKERQRLLAEEEKIEKSLRDPANRRCASCTHYNLTDLCCVKHNREWREEYERLMRDPAHYGETRERRQELSRLSKKEVRTSDTCEDWEVKQ